MKLRNLLVLSLAALLAPLAPAATYTVTNASEFNALPSLGAGDVVKLMSGNYGPINKTITSTIADDATAQSDPVIIRAEVNGGAKFTGISQINFEGRGIVFAGVEFTATSGMIDNGSDTSPAWLIRTNPNSRYVVFSNLFFNGPVAGDNYGNWLTINGFNHTIEYCQLQGKNSRNAVIALKRDTTEAGITTKRNHRIVANYFGPRECSATENGFETIRIGDSDSQAHDMSVLVEGNVFYRAIWRADGTKPNDLEIISNKSKGNIVRGNTFLESYGQITLRHGDACVVEENYIFGGGTYSGGGIVLNAANPYQSGIRIIGKDHTVRNNYLINLAGTGLRAALCLMGGDSTFSDGNGSGGDNGYEVANNASVYNNTFIDCKEMSLGFLNGTSTVSPTGVRIYNNAWQGSGTSNGIVRQSSFTPSGSGGNYIYHPSGSFGWTGLAGSTYTSTASPQITEAFNNILIPASTSPLLNAANTTLVAVDDVRGLTRPSTNRDIGSFEREVAGNGSKPLLRNEVGPEFTGGPSGTYPGTIDTVPVISTTTLPGATAGTPYSQSLAANAGELPLTWSLTAGTLPAGLSLSSGGVISGTPTTAGTSNFTVTVTDVDGDNDAQALSLTVASAGVVASPAFSPAGGTFTTAQTVSLSSSTTGASIRYTTDGSTPTTTTGTLYAGPFNVATTTTVRAIAYKSGFTTSAVTSATYTINTGGGVTEIIPVTWTDSTPWDTAGSNGPDNLWDGSTADGGNGTRWASNASPDTLATASRYVVLDLGANYNLTKFVVWPYASRAYHHEIHVSSDGLTWGTALVNVQPTTGAVSFTHNVSATGRYVRLKIDGISGTTTTWASINEFDIFGSPATGGNGAFLMASNQVVMEAENAVTRTSGGGKSWNNITLTGASGLASNNAIEAGPNSGTTATAPGTGTCRADYQIVVPSGSASTFYVHLRSAGASGSDDSVFLSVNGSTSTYQTFTTTTALGWKTATSTITLPAGTQTLTVWMREDGTQVDKIVVSSSATLPTGTGPAESARQ